MTFANVITLIHTVIILWFNPSTPDAPLKRTLMAVLLVDIGYQIACFVWHLYNSYFCMLVTGSSLPVQETGSVGIEGSAFVLGSYPDY